MPIMVKSQLRSGMIFGDPDNGEYVYMPGSELGVDNPLCLYENAGSREDVSLDEAMHLITARSLKPCTHPFLGKNSC